MLIHGMEWIWQCRIPKRSRQCSVISIKRNDSLMVQDIEVQSNQYWLESLHMKERKTSVTKHGYKRSFEGCKKDKN